jgi:hypothetical protein
VKRDAESEPFFGHFLAGGRELAGDGAIAWTLDSDCEGVAKFAPVLGASDTGGADRTRRLIAEATGACRLHLTMTTGSVTLQPQFASKTFAAQKRVTVQ